MEYMYAIVEHPNYAGMPCTTDAEGKIDWTIPSNRKPGSKNWDGNSRRREWWRAKAMELGIPIEGRWLSRAAKAIHPFGEKPCQTCGRVLTLSYIYPTGRSLVRINTRLPPDAQIEPADLLDVYQVLERLVLEVGEEEAVAAFLDAAAADEREEPASILGTIS